jgi:hypothetical protein
LAFATEVVYDHNGVFANLFLRRFQAGLRATRHQNTSAPIEEQLRRGEPHAAGPADDNGNPAAKLPVTNS